MVKNGWVYCPYCGKKLFPIGKNTVIKNWIYLCRKCGKRFPINIESRE